MTKLVTNIKDLNDQQIKQFELFKDNLLDWNQRMNLTAITDESDIWQKHFVDSLTLLPLLPNGPIKMLDVGSGAGFPGLPIKIMRPDISMTLLDARQKRISFLEDTINRLALQDTRCIHARAEDLKRDKSHSHAYDIVVARAVARLDKLVKWCLPFVKQGGVFLAMKGPNVEEEINESKENIRKLDGEVLKVEYMEIAPGMVHSVIVVCYNGCGSQN